MRLFKLCVISIGCLFVVTVMSGLGIVVSGAGQAASESGAVALPETPMMARSADYPQVRVVVMGRGLSHPWGLAFLPDGNILVTERSGQLRLVRDGQLDPIPIAGVPEVFTGVRLAGLMDIALHPQFVENSFV